MQPNLLFRFPLFLALIAFAASMNAEDDLSRRASWTQPTTQQIRAAANKWAEQLSDIDKLRIQTLWSGEFDDALEFVILSAQAVHREFSEIERIQDHDQFFLRSQAWLERESPSDFVRDNVKLHIGIRLSQARRYNEALSVLDNLITDSVVDPAALLFHRGLCQFRLLELQASQKSVSTLLENEKSIPRRYTTVANLMAAEIQSLKPDTLAEVAYLMDDIKIRMQLGRSGTRVRDEEDKVIDKLDKLIAKLEQEGGT